MQLKSNVTAALICFFFIHSSSILLASDSTDISVTQVTRHHQGVFKAKIASEKDFFYVSEYRKDNSLASILTYSLTGEYIEQFNPPTLRGIQPSSDTELLQKKHNSFCNIYSDIYNNGEGMDQPGYDKATSFFRYSIDGKYIYTDRGNKKKFLILENLLKDGANDQFIVCTFNNSSEVLFVYNLDQCKRDNSDEEDDNQKNKRLNISPLQINMRKEITTLTLTEDNFLFCIQDDCIQFYQLDKISCLLSGYFRNYELQNNKEISSTLKSIIYHFLNSYTTNSFSSKIPFQDDWYCTVSRIHNIKFLPSTINRNKFLTVGEAQRSGDQPTTPGNQLISVWDMNNKKIDITYELKDSKWPVGNFLTIDGELLYALLHQNQNDTFEVRIYHIPMQKRKSCLAPKSYRNYSNTVIQSKPMCSHELNGTFSSVGIEVSKDYKHLIFFTQKQAINILPTDNLKAPLKLEREKSNTYIAYLCNSRGLFCSIIACLLMFTVFINKLYIPSNMTDMVSSIDLWGFLNSEPACDAPNLEESNEIGKL